jgi:hypothetical protein
MDVGLCLDGRRGRLGVGLRPVSESSQASDREISRFRPSSELEIMVIVHSQSSGKAKGKKRNRKL